MKLFRAYFRLKPREENLPKSLLYLFVGFAGNAVGVAQNFQLHVSLQQTTANIEREGVILIIMKTKMHI